MTLNISLQFPLKAQSLVCQYYHAHGDLWVIHHNYLKLCWCVEGDKGREVVVKEFAGGQLLVKSGKGSGMTFHGRVRCLYLRRCVKLGVSPRNEINCIHGSPYGILALGTGWGGIGIRFFEVSRKYNWIESELEWYALFYLYNVFRDMPRSLKYFNKIRIRWLM